MSTQEKRSTACNKTKCAEGQTRFGVACIVALLLECASEGKSENYPQHTKTNSYAHSWQYGGNWSVHGQPQPTVSRSLFPVPSRYSNTAIVAFSHNKDSKSVSKYSLFSPERVVRDKVLPSGYQSTLHRRTATTKLQTKTREIFRLAIWQLPAWSRSQPVGLPYQLSPPLNLPWLTLSCNHRKRVETCLWRPKPRLVEKPLAALESVRIFKVNLGQTPQSCFNDRIPSNAAPPFTQA